MKIAILGYGREGRAVEKFLKKDSEFKRAKIEIRDQTQGKAYLENLDQFDILFRSPGIPFLTPEIQKAREAGVKISSATKLFFSAIGGSASSGERKPLIIGITGSKGKGTTATLLSHILKKAGKKVYLGGNIGTPAPEILSKLSKDSIAILELSSFQLQDLEMSPPIAVVLDVFPEHLDHHASLGEYVDAKTNICRFQRKGDIVFFAKENKLSREIAKEGGGIKHPVAVGEDPNQSMARVVASHLGISDEKIKKALATYKPLPFRRELVRKMKGIEFYNDSAATNPEATAFAIKSLPLTKILIVGGKDKNLDYAPLAAAIRKSEIEQIILIGENKEKIQNALQKNRSVILIRQSAERNLKEAVQVAYRAASDLVASGQSLVAVLFSPASASFDMFKNYEERGEAFNKIVKKLRA